MTHEINWIVPDRLVEIMLSGDLLSEDLLLLTRLDLSSKTKPVYILFNEYRLHLAVPENMLKVLDETQGSHAMIGHIAVCGAPAVIEVFSKLLIKLLRIKGKVTFFPTRELAFAKLEALMTQEA